MEIDIPGQRPLIYWKKGDKYSLDKKEWLTLKQMQAKAAKLKKGMN